MLPPYIGLVGAHTAGKGEVADYLARYHNCFHYSSADPIKDVFARHYSVGQSEEWIEWACYTQEGKAANHPYLEGIFRFSENDEFQCVAVPKVVLLDDSYVRPMTNREVMELIGDGLILADPEVLMRGMEQQRNLTGKSIVDSSTREEAQAKFIRRRGGIIVYIKNDEAEAAAGSHHSNHFYQRTKHDYIIENNKEGIEHLYFEIERWIARITSEEQCCSPTAARM